MLKFEDLKTVRDDYKNLNKVEEEFYLSRVNAYMEKGLTPETSAELAAEDTLKVFKKLDSVKFELSKKKNRQFKKNAQKNAQKLKEFIDKASDVALSDEFCKGLNKGVLKCAYVLFILFVGVFSLVCIEVAWEYAMWDKLAIIVPLTILILMLIAVEFKKMYIQFFTSLKS